MKRLSLLGLVLTIAVTAAFAAPVDVNRAMNCGQKFVNNTLGQKSAALSLAYTQVSEAGTDALYVFNYDGGYVVVAADDRAHPVLGYGEGESFDVNNIPDGLRYLLGYYASQIQYAIDNDLPVDFEIAEQWYLVDKEGVVSKTRGEKVVNPLIYTIWDQGWPYNYYAPACNSYWTNNHCYAGCVATAMSQVMKYWNWPETGVGEHSYTTSTYPGGGAALSVNFGETTYQWSIMPNSCSTANAAAQAVALLMYHCGVAVDMDFDPNGSGAHTEDIPGAVVDHFRYASCTEVKYRDLFNRTDWEDMLIAQLDMGFPMVYSGSDNSGGHAFNCDGYNAQRYFHFNFGWSGSYNNYYMVEALNTGNGSFNQNQRVVINMIPDYIYDAMVPEIATLVAAPADAMTQTVQISFTVPTEAESGAALTGVESVKLMRNGEVIQTFTNLQPGETVTFEDNVSEYGSYEYSVIGYNNGYPGKSFSTIAIVGPQCTWKFVCQTTNFQGWNGGKVQVVGANGVVFKEVTMANTSPVSDKFQMPEGPFTLEWLAPSSTVSSLTIKLNNSANQTVYNYSGSSAQLNGTLFTGDNDCPSCTPPTDFAGEYEYQDGVFGTKLTWNCDYDPSKFKVYRSEDGVEYTEIATVDSDKREYFDEVGIGSYYYKVTAYSNACESTPAQTSENTDYVYVTVTSVGEHNVNAEIFPNPAKEQLSIQAAGITEVSLYNTIGQLVYHYNGLTNSLGINTSDLESGIYIINVVTGEGFVSRRVVIMH